MADNKPTAVKLEYWDGERWNLNLNNGHKVSAVTLERGRSTCDRIIAGQFFPMVGRIINVRA